MSKFMHPSHPSRLHKTDVADAGPEPNVQRPKAPRASSDGSRSNATATGGTGSQPHVEMSVADQQPAPSAEFASVTQEVCLPWTPRANATYLTKGPSGIWYLRIAVPKRIRALRPDLPKEMRRSTETSVWRLAKTRAREICIDFLTRPISKAVSMSAPGISNDDSFSIIYRPGSILINAGSDTSPERLLQLTIGAQQLLKGLAMRDSTETGTDVASTRAHSENRSSRVDVSRIAFEDVLPRVPEPETVALLNPRASAPGCQANSGVIWLSDAIQEWRKSTKFSEETWRFSYEPSFRLLRELLGEVRRDIADTDGELHTSQLDVDIGKITRASIKWLRSGLSELPARQGKRDDGVEARDRILRAQACKAKPMSASNVKKKLTHIQPFMVWSKRKSYISDEVVKEFELAKGEESVRVHRSKDDNSEDEERSYVALSAEELRTVFECTEYLDAASQHEWAYWCPLLQLHGGLRVSEASQLHTGDFICIEGVHCVVIAKSTGRKTSQPKAQTPSKPRRIKTPAARRTVPLHPKLLELGFLDFLSSKQQGERSIHLFDDLSWHIKSQWSRQVSNHIGHILREKGIYKLREKVPHSLRSNFIQAIKGTGLPPLNQDRLFGHSTKKTSDKHYAEADYGPYVAAQLVISALETVDFGINIPRWSEIRAKGMGR